MAVKNKGAFNGVPKTAWKILIALAIAVTIAASMWQQSAEKSDDDDRGVFGKVDDFILNSPKKKFILEGPNKRRYQAHITVVENDRYGKGVIILMVSEYKGGTTWLVFPAWTPAGTITLNPSKKTPGYNHAGVWEDKKGKAPIVFNFDKERKNATGKVYLSGKWHNCWLKL